MDSRICSAQKWAFWQRGVEPTTCNSLVSFERPRSRSWTSPQLTTSAFLESSSRTVRMPQQSRRWHECRHPFLELVPRSAHLPSQWHTTSKSLERELRPHYWSKLRKARRTKHPNKESLPHVTCRFLWWGPIRRPLGCIAWRRRCSKLLLFWQLVHGLGPPCLQDKLSSASSRCKYSLRNPKSMEVPLCSTSAHLSSFLPSCSILWNTLPASVTSCSSLSSFASSLDSFFVDDKFSYGLPP